MNLFLKELIFRCAIISLLTCFMRMELGWSLKETFWGTELHSSTSRHPLLLPSILYQHKILDIGLILTQITIGQNFTSTGRSLCPNQLIWTAPPLQGWTESLEINVFIWIDLVLAGKSSKECSLNHFWQVFRVFFDSVYYRPNFNFYWPTLLSESIHMNRASSARVTESLEISAFIWNNLVLATNSSKECTIIFDKFSV